MNAAGAAFLRAVEPALAQLDEGLRAAAATSGSTEQRIRITLLSSFAQRWLLPRIGLWRERHPDIGLELHTSQNVMDLQRDGFHAALRQGGGQWRGLQALCLTDSPMIALGSPEAAHRLRGRDVSALADEPLLGNAAQWQQWFALNGVRTRVNPVAAFSDGGLKLQTAEQNLGLTLSREILAADALRDGRAGAAVGHHHARRRSGCLLAGLSAQPGRLAAAGGAARLVVRGVGAVAARPRTRRHHARDAAAFDQATRRAPC